VVSIAAIASRTSSHASRGGNRGDRVSDVLPRQSRREVRLAPAWGPRYELRQFLSVGVRPMQVAQERAHVGRGGRSRALAPASDQQIARHSQDVPPGELRERPTSEMLLLPRQHPPCRQNEPFTSLQLQAANDAQVLQIGGKQRAIRIDVVPRGRSRKPFRKAARCMAERGLRSPACRDRRFGLQIAIDNLAGNRPRLAATASDSVGAEAGDPRQIQLDRVALVAGPRQIGRNVINLIAKSAATKAHDHSAILEIVLQHGHSLLLSKPGTPRRRREWNPKYYVASRNSGTRRSKGLVEGRHISQLDA